MTRIGIETLIGWLYPPTCQLCGAPGDQRLDLCAGCRADLPRNAHACGCCALPFDSAVSVGTLCGRCQKRSPPFDRCVAAFRYEGAIPALITGAKFRGRLNAVRLLGQCLAERARELDLVRPDWLVPVPLHPRRQRERGYNQAHEIARILGRELGIPLAAQVCHRVMATPPQAGLDERARRRNIRGAFAATADLAGSHLVIVDDVVTTGSTISELSRILLGAGARRVDVWTVARTP
ncbi:double zinc ribbon domain-containing protein [Thiocystis violacea]|uniref:double zinc ribbon domain-containing protein n=1 Tax=Thiocystis violacea TaxID=13725 RepID=UPI001904B5C9|nr:phosphoribosyltransferase [Thiocystis violacea]